MMRVLSIGVGVALWASRGLAAPPDEEDVLVAALKGEIRFLESALEGPAPVVCVQIDPGGAPQSARKEMVERFRDASVRVVRGAECEVGRSRMFERQTGRRAVMVTAGPIERLSEDEAEVAIAVSRRSSQPSRRRYRVVRESGRWICLGQVMKIPSVKEWPEGWSAGGK